MISSHIVCVLLYMLDKNLNTRILPCQKSKRKLEDKATPKTMRMTGYETPP